MMVVLLDTDIVSFLFKGERNRLRELTGRAVLAARAGTGQRRRFSSQASGSSGAVLLRISKWSKGPSREPESPE